MQSIGNNYLASASKLLRYYKSVGDRAMEQITNEQLHWQYNHETNSIATMVKHIAGNSLSRWTDFLTSDGEKEWRDRDGEFEDTISSKEELLKLWEAGWDCSFKAIGLLTENDLTTIIYIRNEGHTVIEAVNRHLAHIPYHVGQMVFIAKMLAENWRPLTIPKGQSNAFNQDKFAKEKTNQFFADGAAGK